MRTTLRLSSLPRIHLAPSCCVGLLLLLVATKEQFLPNLNLHHISDYEENKHYESPTSKSDLRCPGDMFFGHSEDSEGSLGWLICLDRSSKAGTIYRPPGMLALKQLTWDDSGDVQFISAVFTGDEIFFQFKGRVNGSSLVGTLKIINGSSLTTEKEFHVEASRLRHPRTNGKWTGRYENIEYVEDAGELVGAELILLSDSGPYRGMLTFYGSSWVLSTYQPLLLTDVKDLGPNKSEFVLRWRGTRSFSLTFSRLKTVVSPTSRESWELPRSVTLKRNKDLFPPPFVLNSREGSSHGYVQGEDPANAAATNSPTRPSHGQEGGAGLKR